MPFLGLIQEIPREAWLAGPASRASYLGRLAGPVESIAGTARGLIRGSPGALRRVGRLPGPAGGILAPLLFLEAVEWASEWLRDEAIPALREWARPTSPPDPSPGGRRYGWVCQYEYLDYGLSGFPGGTPSLRSERYEARPDQFFPRVLQVLSPPEYYEQPSASGVSWGLRVKVFRESDPPGNTYYYPAASGLSSKSRYRFKRIVAFEILGDPNIGPTSPALFDPEILYDPEGVPTLPQIPTIPLAVPFFPGTSPLPGDLKIWAPPRRAPSPQFPGEEREPKIDIDWIPRRQNRPDLQRFPGLRIGFRPWGVIIAEIALEILEDFILDPPPISLVGDCPDPCPPLDYERIQRIVEQVGNRLGDVKDVPDLIVGDYTGYESELFLVLDEDIRFIEYQFDTTEYLGGTVNSDLGPKQGWCGLYSFDYGQKEGLDFYSGKIPKPPGAKTFWVQCRQGAKIRIRPLSAPPIPGVIS